EPSLYAVDAGAQGIDAVSSDGRFVLFESTSSNLVLGHNNGLNDIFLRDLQTGTTTCVSVTSNGTSANAASQHAVMTPDGRFVAFDSYATNLTADAVANGTENVFVRDLQSGITTLVSVNSSGTASRNSYSDFPH